MGYKFNIFTGTLDIVGSSSSSSGVTGIAPTGINNIATWADTTATTIQNSQALVQPGGAIEAQGYITKRDVVGTVTVNTGESWIAPSLILSPGGLVVLAPDSELIIV